jgi:hypothetical protein
VLELDGRRISRLLVGPPPAEPAAADEPRTGAPAS